MKPTLHLSKFETTVLSGAEWLLVTSDWVILQLCEGNAYAFASKVTKELPQSGVIVCPPKSSITMMASVLGQAVFRGMAIQLSSLSGFLTAMERQCLETEVARQCAPFLVLPADHPLAKRLMYFFLHEDNMTLPNRLAVAQTFAELLAPQMHKALQQGEETEKGQQGAKERLRHFISQMPESELADISLEQMAKLLHCCERHVSRLFREVCGTRFLTYVSELRLKKSCHLLLQRRLKIIDIALESGYGSLAHFNYAFKKRFGMTPTGWRERNAPTQPATQSHRRKPLQTATLMIWLLFTLFGLSKGICATPAAGPDTNRTATTTNQVSPRFRVDRYEVKGNTLLATNVISRLLSPYTGAAVDLDTVKKALGALQMEYRARGYLTVAVAVPPQQVTNKTICFKVTEGRLAEVSVLHNHFFSSNNIMRALPGLGFETDRRIINAKLFQTDLDRANTNPDRQISPELRPGSEPGTSDLILDVKDRFPLHGRLEFDNDSPPGTPANRLNGNLAYGNLWQLDHTLGLQYGFSPDRMKDTLDVPNLGLNPLDAPQISDYSAFYRMPLGAPESVENQIAQDPTHFGFNQETRQLVLPPAIGRPEFVLYGSRSTTGNPLQVGPLQEVIDTDLENIRQQAFSAVPTSETTIGGRFSIPLPNWAGVQSTLSFGLDYKDYKVETLATNTFYTTTTITNSSGTVVTNSTNVVVAGNRFSSVTYVPVFLGWTGSRPDKWGQMNGSLSLTLGTGGTFTHEGVFPTALEGPKPSSTAFATIRPQLSRSQKLFDNFTLYANATGQWANEPVINLEQFALGGTSSVRGYREGERYGDTGYLTQGELRSPTYWIGSDRRIGAEFAEFTDYGDGHLLFPGSGQKADQALWGAGVVMNFTLGPYMESHIVLAWPLNNSNFTKAGRERITFSLSAQL
jgi:hemolysin activation/secretion protein/AraC-like DNA-binding protein